jgi:hypothetical protein
MVVDAQVVPYPLHFPNQENSSAPCSITTTVYDKSPVLTFHITEERSKLPIIQSFGAYNIGLSDTANLKMWFSFNIL